MLGRIYRPTPPELMPGKNSSAISVPTRQNLNLRLFLEPPVTKNYCNGTIEHSTTMDHGPLTS